MRRFAAKIDNNQKEIVRQLRQIPGVTVKTGHDDILVGNKGKTFWYEIKDKSAFAKRTGELFVTKKQTQKSQAKLKECWKGHYRIVSSFEEIFEEIQ
jgi:hypothetical protein